MVDKLVRFLLASLVNNAVTILLYQGLLFVVSPSLSFIIAWAVGIVMVVTLYPQHVFRVEKPALRDKATISVIYGLSFIVGLIIIRLMDADPLMARLSIFVVLLSNFFLNFGINNLLLGRRKPS